MPRSSAARVPPSSQPSGGTVASRYAELRLAIADRVESLRSLMIGAAPHGFQVRVADLMQARKERISRELQRVEKLSVELFLTEVAMHREEGRPETADRLLAILNEGQPIRISTDRGIVIRLRDGQMFLDLEKP
jgi:hypothetical protein